MKIKKHKTQKNKSKKKNDDLITIVLLCDSPGYRMKSYGPLQLINISNTQKLLDLQIKAISQAFEKFEIILCTGFDSEKIYKYIKTKYSYINIRIVENQTFNTSNTCEAARLSLNNTLNSKIIICDGHLWFSHKTLKLIDKNHTCVLIEQQPSVNLEIGLNIDNQNEVQHFSFGANYIWSEILYLHNDDAIEMFKKIMLYPDNKNKFIFEALNEMLKLKHKIKCINNNYPIQKISNIKTYHSIRENA